MGRFRVLLTIVALSGTSVVLFGGPATAVPPPPGTFTVTPNPVVAGHDITFAGTGCRPIATDPPGTLTVIVDSIVPAGAARSAAIAPMSDSPLQITPDEKGNWSSKIQVPIGALPGTYQFSAVCDRYNDSVGYPPVTLTVQINLEAPAKILLLDFLGMTTVPQLSVGTRYEFVGTGFRPGEKVQLAIHSDPVVLATLVADPQFGFVDEFLTLPPAIVNGAHTLTLHGGTSDKSASIAITVAGGAAPSTAVTPTTTSTSTTMTTVTSTTTVATLASTGAAAAQTLWFGAMLTLLGVATLLLARRRTKRAH